MVRIGKIAAVLLSAVCVYVPLSAAAQEPKTLVVFYSRDGHTREVAQALAKRFNADIEELRDLRKRTGPVGNTAAGKDAIAGNRTRIAGVTYDPAQYDIVLVGTPSWFGNPTPAVRTYLGQHDLSRKTVGVFGTAHLTGVAGCMEKLAALINKDQDIPKLPLVHADLGAEKLPGKIEVFYGKVMALAASKGEEAGALSP
jgi:flavodoxin